MSDQVVPDVPTFTALASVKGGSKDAFWQSNQNWKKELESREGHPHGHPLNPKDGFWNWYRKYQFVNNLNDKGQPRVSKKPRISKKKAEVSGYKYFDAWRKENREKLDEVYKQYLEKFPKRPNRSNPTLHKLSKSVPYTSGIERVADLVSGDSPGTVLLGHDYIGPGNPIYRGDDKELTSTDRIAKEHDVQYGLISEYAQTKEEVRALTDKADTEGIKKFWNDSRIGEQIFSGNIPDFGSLFGAAGLLDDSDDEVGGPIEVQAEVHEHPPDIESEDEGLEYLDDFDFDLQNELMAQVPGTGTAMEVGSTTGNASSAKRKAESAGGIGKKRPGTGHDTEDSGASISGDTGIMMGPIQRPIVNRDGDSDIRVYRKVHRFTTFGLAYKPIQISRGFESNTWTDVFMTTPLAEIPWNRLFMYMNPSEYSLLPSGSSVIDLHIKIRQRNVRVAFQTNSTTSELATLNQNKNAIFADGLLQYAGGENVAPTAFAANQAMIPTAITTELTNSAYNQFVDQFYGVQNTNDGFLTGSPRHQFGIPYILPFYYAMQNSVNDSSLSGWPCLQEYYHEFNADETSNTVFLERHYKPKMGLITTPIDAIINAYPQYGASTGTVQIAKGTGLSNANTLTNYSNVLGAPTQLALRDDDTSTNAFENAARDTYFSSLTFPYQINQIIEKDQIFTTGLRHESNNSASQPSLHIGIQPVPALTTTSIPSTSIDNQFTDTQCYWEVICTAKVKVMYPTRRPLATVANVSSHQLFWRMCDDTGVEYDLLPQYTMRDGLYVTKATTPPGSVARASVPPVLQRNK
uniref:Structural protein n=1 Tax=Planococcus citri densovirus TaxID=159153 RepID=A0A218L3N7_9VIRU|nr:structural protein [Planococcus citri densovirus]